MHDHKMWLLPKRSLECNDDDDPLIHYYRPIIGQLYRKRIETGLSLLNPPYERIIEVGYGSGVLLPTLSKLGRSISGVDLVSDPEEVRNRLRKYNVDVDLYKADICKWDFSGEKFDLIVAFSVLEHIRNPSEVLEKLHALLNSNGVLLLGMPRVDRFMSLLFSLIGYSTIEDYHITTYKEVLASATPFFRVQNLKTFPLLFPRWGALYFTIVLEKIEPSGTVSGQETQGRSWSPSIIKTSVRNKQC